MKPKAQRRVVLTDLNTPQALEIFRKAAKAFNKRFTKSKKIARQQLVDEGICTKAGRLTKQYR